MQFFAVLPVAEPDELPVRSIVMTVLLSAYAAQVQQFAVSAAVQAHLLPAGAEAVRPVVLPPVCRAALPVFAFSAQALTISVY